MTFDPWVCFLAQINSIPSPLADIIATEPSQHDYPPTDENHVSWRTTIFIFYDRREYRTTMVLPWCCLCGFLLGANKMCPCLCISMGRGDFWGV